MAGTNEWPFSSVPVPENAMTTTNAPTPVPPFTPEHTLFRKTVRQFAEKELAPHTEE